MEPVPTIHQEDSQGQPNLQHTFGNESLNKELTDSSKPSSSSTLIKHEFYSQEGKTVESPDQEITNNITVSSVLMSGQNKVPDEMETSTKKQFSGDKQNVDIADKLTFVKPTSYLPGLSFDKEKAVPDTKAHASDPKGTKHIAFENPFLPELSADAISGASDANRLTGQSSYTDGLITLPSAQSEVSKACPVEQWSEEPPAHVCLQSEGSKSHVSEQSEVTVAQPSEQSSIEKPKSGSQQFSIVDKSTGEKTTQKSSAEDVSEHSEIMTQDSEQSGGLSTKESELSDGLVTQAPDESISVDNTKVYWTKEPEQPAINKPDLQSSEFSVDKDKATAETMLQAYGANERTVLSPSIEQSMTQSAQSESPHKAPEPDQLDGSEAQVSVQLEETEELEPDRSNGSEARVQVQTEETEAQGSDQSYGSEAQVPVQLGETEAQEPGQSGGSEAPPQVKSEETEAQESVQSEARVQVQSEETKTQKPEQSDGSEAQVPVQLGETEAQGPDQSHGSEAQVPVKSEETEAQVPVQLGETEAQGPDQSHGSEAQVPVKSEEIEAQVPVQLGETEAQEPDQSGGSEARPQVKSEETEAQEPVQSDKSEARVQVQSEETKTQKPEQSDGSEAQVQVQSEETEAQEPDPSYKSHSSELSVNKEKGTSDTTLQASGENETSAQSSHIEGSVTVVSAQSEVPVAQESEWSGEAVEKVSKLLEGPEGRASVQSEEPESEQSFIKKTTYGSPELGEGTTRELDAGSSTGYVSEHSKITLTQISEQPWGSSTNESEMSVTQASEVSTTVDRTTQVCDQPTIKKPTSRSSKLSSVQTTEDKNAGVRIRSHVRRPETIEHRESGISSGKDTVKMQFTQGITTPVLTGFIAVVVFIFYIWTGQPQSSNSISPILQIFHNQFNILKADFPGQNSELWLRSGKMLEKHLNKSQPLEPVTFILAAAQNGERTLRCLSERFAKAYADSVGARSLTIDGPSKTRLDGISTKLQIDQELSSGFESTARAAVFYRLETLPPSSLLILYKYCDHENAAFKKVALVLTVLLEEESLNTDMSLISLEEKVKDFLWEQFITSDSLRSHSEMDGDKLSGVWSRISHLVLPVLPVKSIENGICP